MNVFFDVDFTILDSEGALLRPFVKEVFERITADGHSIYLWSGMGPRWEVVEAHGLQALVKDCFEKPLSNHEIERVRIGIPVRPDYVVDDSRTFVSVYGGFVIPCFSPWKCWLPLDAPDRRNTDDTEMLRAYEAIKQFVAGNGKSAYD